MSQPSGAWDGQDQSGLFRNIRTSIRRKLLLGMLAVAFVPMLAMAATVYWNVERVVFNKTTDQLAAIRSVKASQIEQLFQALEAEVASLAESQTVVSAVSEFQRSFRTAIDENDLKSQELQSLRDELHTFYATEFTEEYRRMNNGRTPNVDLLVDPLSDEAVLMQYHYVRNNPNPIGKKALLDRAADQSSYSDQHEKYHPLLRGFMDRFRLSNILLIDAETGDVIYSCSKELDYATSLKNNGPHAKSGLGFAYKHALSAENSDDVSVLDFKPHQTSYEQPAMFLSAPVFDTSKRIGVIVFQVPINQVAAILEDRTGLGETGETLAVGFDHLLRNNSRFFKELPKSDTLQQGSTILNSDLRVESTVTDSALAGDTGINAATDYRGTMTLTAWQPVSVHKSEDKKSEITWALLTKIDQAEVREPVTRLFFAMLAIAALATIVVLISSYAMASNLTRQTDSISGMLNQIGMGDFEARAEVLSEDELGTVAMSLNAMCDNTLSLIQTREERDRIQLAVQKLKEEVAIIASGDLTQEAEVTEDVTGGIAESINHMIFQLRTIITNLHETVNQVTISAGEIQKTTDHLSAGSEQQSRQITETSAAIEEMASSIQQVSQNTQKSATVANKARENAEQGTRAVQNTMDGMDRIRDQVQENAKRIKRLGESSQEVGEIVQLIGDIADRTSILALNASIQAAMAGDAGKGFAVVAEEVELLAERANHATKQIESLIKAIQRETSEAITAMEVCTQEVVSGSKLASEAGYTLGEIDSVSKELAELIESITEMTRQQAQTAEVLAESMNEISSVTRETALGTKHAALSIDNLAELSDALQSSVAAFRLPRSKPRSSLVFDHSSEHTGPVGSLILKALK